MKSEAVGSLVADASLVDRLHMSGMASLQCMIASALWMVKPVQPCEAALHVMQVPIIQKSRAVTSVSSSPPTQRYNFIRGSNQFCRSSVEKYMNRPSGESNEEAANSTFYS